MSEEEYELLVKGLEKAEYNMLRMKSMRNEMVLQNDSQGNIIRVPAREIFTRLYNEPAPMY